MLGRNNFCEMGSSCEVILLSSSDDNSNMEMHHSQPRSVHSSSPRSLKAQGNSDFSSSQSSGKESKLSPLKRPRATFHSVSESDDDSDFSLPSLGLGERLRRNKVPSLGDDLLDSAGSSLTSQSEAQHRKVDVVHLSSEDEICVPEVLKKPKVTNKSQRTSEKLRERERKKEEKELAKALKNIEREVKKNDKPQERLKSMKVVLDSHFEEIPGVCDLFSSLDNFEFKYSVERNHLPFSVVWYHKVTDVEIVNNKAQMLEREELQNYLLLFLTKSFFIDKVNASMQKRKKNGISYGQTLLDYVVGVKTVFPLMKITCVTLGLEDYFREKAEERKKKKDSQVPRNVKDGQTLKNVSRKDIEEAMIEVQLQAVVNFKLLDKISQFVDLLSMYTKAIAEAPLKRERHQQQGFSWYADADSSCPVRIAKDGTGLISLWQQQICQFQNVGKEVAQAIAAEYPSPMRLMEAYRKCTTKQQAEKLLQDIVVRRGFGPLGTTRRIGPELSYKIYLFFTSTDGNHLIQR